MLFIFNTLCLHSYQLCIPQFMTCIFKTPCIILKFLLTVWALNVCSNVVISRSVAHTCLESIASIRLYPKIEAIWLGFSKLFKTMSNNICWPCDKCLLCGSCSHNNSTLSLSSGNSRFVPTFKISRTADWTSAGAGMSTRRKSNTLKSLVCDPSTLLFNPPNMHKLRCVHRSFKHSRTKRWCSARFLNGAGGSPL